MKRKTGPETYAAGKGPAARGALAAMAGRLAIHARQLGLTVVKVRRSRMSFSQTHTLIVRDDAHNLWTLSISAFSHRGTQPHTHFELTTRDGVSGEQWAMDSLAIIAAGAVEWFPIGQKRRA